MRAFLHGSAFIRSEDGSTAAEYGIILALVVTALVIALTDLGDSIVAAVEAVGAKMMGSP